MAKGDGKVGGGKGEPQRYASSSGWQGYSKCSHNGRPCIDMNDVLLGGASSGGALVERATLVVDLSSSQWGHNQPQLPAWVAPFAPSKETLRVVWPDGHRPPVPIEFFRACYEHVAASNDKEKILVFACMGGHGRTGTALAATLIAVLGWSAKKSIEFVRKVHCDNAVETATQIKWLCLAAGQGEDPTTIKGSYQTVSHTWGGGGAAAGQTGASWGKGSGLTRKEQEEWDALDEWEIDFLERKIEGEKKR